MGGIEEGERPKRKRIYVYIQLIHFLVNQQKLTQYCEAINPHSPKIGSKLKIYLLMKTNRARIWIYVNKVYCLLLKNNFPMCIYLNLRKIKLSKMISCSPNQQFNKFHFKIFLKIVQILKVVSFNFSIHLSYKVPEPLQQTSSLPCGVPSLSTNPVYYWTSSMIRMT